MRNRRLSFVLVFVCLLNGVTLVAQSSSQDTSREVLGNDQQNQLAACPDGSPAIPTSDGRVECNGSIQQPTSFQSNQTDTRKSSTAAPGEKSEIGAAANTREPRQNQSPEQLTEFQKFVASTTGQLLAIYGEQLFRNVPSTYSPSDLAPVTSDYVIGPDDELRIRIWGQVNYSGNLRVDRTGDIYIPEVGAVNVAGLQYSTLDQRLRTAVGRIYRNFDLSADMGRIRSMQIYVAGQARRPGAYTVSSLSSLVDALFASGGPSAQGSLRHIELRRSGKTVVDFDLYALLIRGDKSKDARLLPEDVIYIPPAGPEVAIFGSVRSPAIYEARDQETIGDLLDAAGRSTALASSARLSVERAGENQIRQAMEFPLDATGQATRLVSGDIVRVYAVVPAYQKTVTLRGNVANPGRFAWHAGMHLSELIPDRDSLFSRDYWWKRSHLGLPAPEFEPFLTNLEANQSRTNRTAQNTYNSNSTDTTNQELISPRTQQELTTSLTANDKPETEIRPREIPDTRTLQDQRVTQDSIITGGSASIASQTQNRQTTESDGTNPARKTDVRTPTQEIDWNYAVIERLDPQTLRTSLESFDLGKLVLNHDTSQDLLLQPGDTVTIFSQADVRVPLAEQTKYVRLEGEFQHAGVYSVRPGETLRDLVARAGGITSDGYLYGSEFDRESTRVLQQQRIDEYVRRADLDASRGALALTASPSSSSTTVNGASAATLAESQLLSRLKQIRATGRIVLNFPPSGAGLDAIPAVPLENGDRFIVPPAPATVNVVGAVYDQNSFLYHRGGSAGQYLKTAGGPDRDADWRRTFVIRADGSVVNRPSVTGLWGNEFNKLKLNPGDTIVVPDKTIRPTALRGFLDWSQIFSQLALGAAAINVLH